MNQTKNGKVKKDALTLERARKLVQEQDMKSQQAFLAEYEALCRKYGYRWEVGHVLNLTPIKIE